MKWPWVTRAAYAELEARWKRDTGGLSALLAQSQVELGSARETNEKLRKLCNEFERKQRDLDDPPISAEDLAAHLKLVSELQSENGALFRVNAELQAALADARVGK